MQRVVLMCNGACCVTVQWSVLCYCVMERVVLLCNGACCVTVQWSVLCYCEMEHVVNKILLK